MVTRSGFNRTAELERRVGKQGMPGREAKEDQVATDPCAAEVGIPALTVHLVEPGRRVGPVGMAPAATSSSLHPTKCISLKTLKIEMPIGRYFRARVQRRNDVFLGQRDPQDKRTTN